MSVGVSDGMLPDITLVLSGKLFVATASIHNLCMAFNEMEGKPPKDLAQVCSFFISGHIKELQAS